MGQTNLSAAMKKISLMFVLLLMSAVSFTTFAQDPGSGYDRGDTNLDGEVSISDVTVLIDYLLTGEWTSDNYQIDDGYEYVNLQLPSGTLWATTNVGARSPEEFGDYFAWGEIQPKEAYEWDNYKWCNGSYNEMTKYCTDPNFGTVDHRKVLLMSDDAAFKNISLRWRMPTYDEVYELMTYCTWEWAEINGVWGYRVKNPNSSNERYLFLPAAGYKIGGELRGVGENGSYWTRTLYPDVNAGAYDLEFNQPDISYWEKRIYFEERFFGFPVRAVLIRH